MKRIFKLVILCLSCIACFGCLFSCAKDGSIANGVYIRTATHIEEFSLSDSGSRLGCWKIQGDRAKYYSYDKVVTYKAKIVERNDKIYFEGYKWRAKLFSEKCGSETVYEVTYDESSPKITLKEVITPEMCSKHVIGNDGCCVKCSAVVYPGVIYQVSADGKSAEVSGYKWHKDNAEVVIADTYKNLPVTTILEGAFYWDTQIKKLEIGNNVATIKSGAFQNCYNITSITVGEKVETIEEEAFVNCVKLVEIYNKSALDIKPTNLYSKENGNIGGYAKHVYTPGGDSKLSTDDNGYMIYVDGEQTELISYVGNKAYTNLTLPNNLTKINDYAFYRNIYVIAVTIGDNVTEIGKGAFWGCTSLTLIDIGDGVEKIGMDAISHTSSLEQVKIGKKVNSIGSLAFVYSAVQRFVVDENNATFKSVDGNLYSKDGEMLVQYASGKTEIEFNVPEGVSTIGENAFLTCKNLKRVTVANDVNEIKKEAFWSCDSLEKVVIGGQIQVINDAFIYCDNPFEINIGKGVADVTRIFFKCNVVSITVDELNPYFKSVEGNLYSKDGKSLVQYASGNTAKEFIVPDDVEIISEYAFWYCNNLEHVVIGDSVQEIKGFTFQSCKNLKQLTIGASVSSILPNFLASCSEIQTIIVDENNQHFKIVNGDLYTIGGSLVYDIA